MYIFLLCIHIGVLYLYFSFPFPGRSHPPPVTFVVDICLGFILSFYVTLFSFPFRLNFLIFDLFLCILKCVKRFSMTSFITSAVVFPPPKCPLAIDLSASESNPNVTKTKSIWNWRREEEEEEKAITKQTKNNQRIIRNSMQCKLSRTIIEVLISISDKKKTNYWA